MKKHLPLISCICVTEGRPQLLEKAIKMFHLQSYLNKELVIAFNKNDIPTLGLLKKIPSANVLLIMVDETDALTLGGLRNLAIEKSNGELICCWDDDDWYHFRRLEIQFAVIKASKKKGCILSKILIFDEKKRQVYYSFERNWEGSLMCYRSVFKKNSYAALQKSEDFELVKNLHLQGLLYRINTIPDLYIYRFHGNNTWHSRHFESFFLQSTPLSKNPSMKIADILNSNEINSIDSVKIGMLTNNSIWSK